MTVGYGNILFPEELPLDPARLSNGLPRAELEIGFGNGEFTVEYAAAHPDTLLIGMEVSPSCIARCARRSGHLSNLRIVCTDARFMMKELFVDASLDRVCMNFPCPWPKNRHARRRVTTGEFSDDLAAVLKIGGVFELVTDEEWYALEAGNALSRHEALSVASYEVGAKRAITTKYERKWLAMGRNIVRLTLTKTKNFTVERWTWSFKNGECDEVHVKTGRPPSREELEKLFGASGVRGDARWVFKRLFRDADLSAPDCWLVETISTDDEFEQRYYLKVSARGNDTLIKLDGTAKVYLTPSVRLAVADLGRRLSACAG
ncbi:MAG: tRNA (guanosine(46)-N7)-methyltransferase TrmB [Synergistaceae bacterium]|jgi:tRNA (guanine-N7-)-methyltransferase|nr:tRNA (guanosine(46)-N7)-methyltransferase TrmB [Synergistaceae bacterium]